MCRSYKRKKKHDTRQKGYCSAGSRSGVEKGRVREIKDVWAQMKIAQVGILWGKRFLRVVHIGVFACVYDELSRAFDDSPPAKLKQ